MLTELLLKEELDKIKKNQKTACDNISINQEALRKLTNDEGLILS